MADADTARRLAEALPGVITPLTWTFYAHASEISVRTAFAELGVLRRSEITWPADPDQRFIGVFCGRAAINLDQFRAMADRRLKGRRSLSRRSSM